MPIKNKTSNTYNVCAIIPAYNEEKEVGNIVRETIAHVNKVFLIDDASTDTTAKVASNNGAYVIKHEHNQGSGAAQRTGYSVALKEGFDYIVQLDADGQHKPQYIPEMLRAMNDYDMLIGSRFLNSSYRKYPFIRRIGITFFTLVVNIFTRAHITDVTSGFRLYKADALRKIPPIPDRQWAVYQTIAAAKLGLRIKEISIEMPLRKNGASQLDGYKIFLYPFKMLPAIFKSLLISKNTIQINADNKNS